MVCIIIFLFIFIFNFRAWERKFGSCVGQETTLGTRDRKPYRTGAIRERKPYRARDIRERKPYGNRDKKGTGTLPG